MPASVYVLVLMSAVVIVLLFSNSLLRRRLDVFIEVVNNQSNKLKKFEKMTEGWGVVAQSYAETEAELAAVRHSREAALRNIVLLLEEIDKLEEFKRDVLSPLGDDHQAS